MARAAEPTASDSGVWRDVAMMAQLAILPLHAFIRQARFVPDRQGRITIVASDLLTLDVER
jgi:hypothetical protein